MDWRDGGDEPAKMNGSYGQRLFAGHATRSRRGRGVAGPSWCPPRERASGAQSVASAGAVCERRPMEPATAALLQDAEKAWATGDRAAAIGKSARTCTPRGRLEKRTAYVASGAASWSPVV